MAVEKPITTKLLKSNSNPRIFPIDSHAALVFTGFLSDGHRLVRIARNEAKQFRDNYHFPITPEILKDRLSLYLQAYTMYSSVRPFGISAFLAITTNNTSIGDDNVYSSLPSSNSSSSLFLYQLESSGVAIGFQAIASGKGKQAAKGELEKLNTQTLNAEEAIDHVARIMWQSRDEAKDKDYELEIGLIEREKGWKPVNASRRNEANEKAKNQMEI